MGLPEEARRVPEHHLSRDPHAPALPDAFRRPGPGRLPFQFQRGRSLCLHELRPEARRHLERNPGLESDPIPGGQTRGSEFRHREDGYHAESCPGAPRQSARRGPGPRRFRLPGSRPGQLSRRVFRSLHRSAMDRAGGLRSGDLDHPPLAGRSEPGIGDDGVVRPPRRPASSARSAARRPNGRERASSAGNLPAPCHPSRRPGCAGENPEGAPDPGRSGRLADRPAQAP